MKIKTGMLAFEVTRRCNEICSHCCKGKAEPIDMTKKIIDKIFKNPNYKIEEVKYLSITGGEPTLVPEIVTYLIDTIIKEEIVITSNINFLTNGLIYDETITNAIERLINYLRINDSCKNTRIVFELSNDQFHKRPSKEVIEKYKKLAYIDKRFLEPTKITKERILNVGNAKENGLGGNKTYKDYLSPIDIKLDSNTITIKNELIIAANGNVTPIICGTYKDEDANSWGNVINEDLTEIIIKQKKSIV